MISNCHFMIKDHLQDQIQYYFDEDEEKDVILVCDDGKVVAHKIILSACSPVFKDILQDSTCSDGNTILLPGINHQDVKLLLQFLYTGKVAVSQEEMKSTIELGKIFQIKKLLTFNGVEVSDKDDIDKVIEVPDTKEELIQHLNLNDKKNTKIDPLKFSTPVLVPKTANKEFENLAEKVKKQYSPPSPPSTPASDDDKLNCPRCDKKFSNSQNRRYHMIHVHEGKNYPCTNCERQFSSNQLMKNHRSTVHSLFTCKECNQDFSSIDLHTRHMNEEHKSKELLFLMDDNVQKKVKQEDDNTEGLVACPECDKLFTLKHNMRAHHRVAHGNRKFSCTECDNQYRSAQNLKRHIRDWH